MEELLQWLEYIEDIRQERKVRHQLKDLLVIVLFATLANADDWVEIAMFAEAYQDYLRNYIELKNGIPSHDTICRVMGLISPDILQQVYGKWQELLNRNEGEILKKVIAVDGRPCAGTVGRVKKRIILYRHGVKKTDTAWVRRQWRKKAMKSQRFRSCWIRFR